MVIIPDKREEPTLVGLRRGGLHWVREIARIANLSRELGYQLEKENRMPTKDEACVQLGHSVGLLKEILDWVRGFPKLAAVLSASGGRSGRHICQISMKKLGSS
jgi:hypothetical protein